jgi:hypothetical protein
VRLGGREYEREHILAHTGDVDAVGGVRSVVLDDGLERGIRALEFRTGGGLRFEVLIDRAMDIGVAEFDDYSFGWRSATGFRHPGLHEVNDEDGLSWLRSMSGLIVTCGLDHTLFGGQFDASNYRYPPKATIRHGLHGRVANIPARLIGYGSSWNEDEAVLWAEGEIRQAAIFGEHLVLRRRVEADLGGNEIRLTDTVINDGFDRTPHMFLYHCNLGWQLLDEGAEFQANVRATTWSSESARTQGSSNLRFGPPTPGFIEQVYEHQLDPDPDGKVRVRLINRRIRRAFELEYSPLEFPSFFQWCNLRAGDYAIGLEPSTHSVSGEEGARSGNTMIWLEHGEQRLYRSAFRFLRTLPQEGDLALRNELLQQ